MSRFIVHKSLELIKHPTMRHLNTNSISRSQEKEPFEFIFCYMSTMEIVSVCLITLYDLITL